MMKHKRLFFGFLAFLIPFILLVVVFNFNGLFDKHLVIKGDVYAQLFPLLRYFKGILNGTNSIFYSFYKNLGGTMYGTFFYYLSSPFNLLIKFIKVEDIPLFFMWLAVIKMSLCGLTMYLYMTYKNKTTNLLIVAFSVCYALMGYNLNFFSNIMWLDVVILAPIVLIGLDKLICGKSPLLYVVSLFVSIVCNYYIAYMLCIFCLIYFIYEVMLKNFDKKQIICVTKRFIIISLLIGLMCSFFLIPCMFESKNYFRSLDFKNIFSFNFNIFNVFSKTYVGSANFKDLLNYSSINIYCGVIVLLLVYLFLVNKNISKKKRMLTLSIIIFMILPCFIFPLNYVWHLFSSPNYCNYRYSFLLCFFFINIAYESYNNLNIKKNIIIPFFFIYLVISIYFICISFIKYYSFISYINIFITFIFLIIYIFVLKRYKMNKACLLFLMIFLEMFFNLIMIFNNKSVFSRMNLVDDDYISMVQRYKDSRMEFTDFLTFNDSILMEYYGINNFLSSNNNRVMRFFMQIAYKQRFIDQNIYNYSRGQYISDSIVGLKYIVSSYEIYGYILVDKVIIDGKDYYVYENPNYLGIGYMINNSCNGIVYDFYYDQNVFNCLFNKNYIFYKEYSVSKDDDGYSVIIKNPSMFYLYYPDIAFAGISFNHDIDFFNKNYAYMHSDNKNYIFKFNVDEKFDFDKFKIYYFDFDKYRSIYKSIANEKLDYKIINNKLYGNISTNGGILMLTIPYEKGFNIKVDGKTVDYMEVLDTFIGINLEKGNHDIVVEYNQPYLKYGIVISIVSLLVLVFYIKKDIDI